MRVICIEDKDQFDEPCPVKKGRIYTVLDALNLKREEFDGYYHRAGIWYRLMEMPHDKAYMSDMFIEIEEDQQDETEFERNYQTQTAHQ